VNYTQQFSKNATKLTAVGVGFLAVTSIMLLITIDRAFNDIWRVKRPRSIVQRVFVYWTLLTVGPVLIGASLSLTSWAVGQAAGLVKGLPYAAVVLLTVVPVLLTSIALALLYVSMPNRRIRLRDAAIGGLLAGIVFEVTKRAFAFYVAQFPTYTLVYGAFASLPIFLVWIYVSWLVVIFGAVVVAALPEWRDRAGQTQPVPGSDFFDALQILKILWRAHHSGAIVRPPDLLAATTVRIEQVEAILDTMTGAGWVSRTVPNGWALHRDPATMTVEDAYRLFVFRGDAHRPARAADPDLEALIHELGARVSADMRITLDALFRAAEESDVLPRQDSERASGERERVPAAKTI
jgi:membrane protein